MKIFGLFLLKLTDVNPRPSELKSVPIPGLANIYFHDFSPDGKHILVNMYDEGGKTNILNLETMTLSEEFSSRVTPDDATWGVYWLP